MGSPYHWTSRHTVVSLSVPHVWDIIGKFCYNVCVLLPRFLLMFSNFYYIGLIYWLLSFIVFFFSTVKVVCLKLIWHFPKITPSGRLKWNLSQIFGILMVSTCCSTLNNICYNVLFNKVNVSSVLKLRFGNTNDLRFCNMSVSRNKTCSSLNRSTTERPIPCDSLFVTKECNSLLLFLMIWFY